MTVLRPLGGRTCPGMPETPPSSSPFQGLRGPTVPPREERQTIPLDRRPTQEDSERHLPEAEPVDARPLGHHASSLTSSLGDLVTRRPCRLVKSSPSHPAAPRLPLTRPRRRLASSCPDASCSLVFPGPPALPRGCWGPARPPRLQPHPCRTVRLPHAPRGRVSEELPETVPARRRVVFSRFIF